MLYINDASFGKSVFTIYSRGIPTQLYAIPCGTNIRFQAFTTESGYIPIERKDHSIVEESVIFYIGSDFFFRPIIGVQNINRELNKIFIHEKPGIDQSTESYCSNFYFNWMQLDQDDFEFANSEELFEEYHVYQLYFEKKTPHDLFLRRPYDEDQTGAGTMFSSSIEFTPSPDLALQEEEEENSYSPPSYGPKW